MIEVPQTCGFLKIILIDINFRLMSPETNQKSSLFPKLGSKFRYSGRTHYETKKTPIERPAPQFERSLTGKRLASRSMDRKLLNKTVEGKINISNISFRRYSS